MLFYILFHFCFIFYIHTYIYIYTFYAARKSNHAASIEFSYASMNRRQSGKAENLKGAARQSCCQRLTKGCVNGLDRSLAQSGTRIEYHLEMQFRKILPIIRLVAP